jgi:hypothetical protein
MPEDARETARRLHVTRGPNAANGTLGPFHWSDDPHDGLEVKRTDVELLLRAGFLCHDNEAAPAELVMPRRVRELLSVHADALDAELVTGLHAQLSADTAFHQRTKEQQIEIHHHAARAGDLERVRSTALYYGFELRSLATRLSRDRKFEDAAALFRELVQEFDREDPYAWEYLGFNLALGDKQARKPGDRATEILAAYEMAHRLDRKNPLYHGRHLGYRAERGYPVGSEVRSAIQHYAERGDAGELVSWFLMPVMDGLFRAHRHAERDAILGEWHTLLEWCAPKVLEKHLPVEE